MEDPEAMKPDLPRDLFASTIPAGSSDNGAAKASEATSSGLPGDPFAETIARGSFEEAGDDAVDPVGGQAVIPETIAYVSGKPAVKSAPVSRPMIAVDLAQFERSVVEIGLIDPAELARILDPLPADRKADAEHLARELVRAGKLTRYQAAAVYQGKTKGLLIGNYLVLDKLGVGGMGIVFKARHRERGTLVALKLLPPSFSKDRAAVLRFEREAEVLATLKHPNIVSAHEVFEFNGLHLLVMDFVDGYDLGRIVATRRPLPVMLAVDCVIQAARGLREAHSKKIVHRDIKPANLVFSTSGVLKILDLGLAQVNAGSDPFGATAPGLTHSGMFMGTVDFMSPEQAYDSKRVDHRADIYSLGCTLFYLLTGRGPFPGETIMQRLLGHRETPVPSLREARQEVTYSLDATFRKMLAKRPEDRPQSMDEVIAALETCLGSAETEVVAETIDLVELFDDEKGPSRTSASASAVARGASTSPADSDSEAAKSDEPESVFDLLTDVASGLHAAAEEEEEEEALAPLPKAWDSPEPEKEPFPTAGVLTIAGGVVLVAILIALVAIRPWSRQPTVVPPKENPGIIAREPPEEPAPEVASVPVAKQVASPPDELVNVAPALSAEEIQSLTKQADADHEAGLKLRREKLWADAFASLEKARASREKLFMDDLKNPKRRDDLAATLQGIGDIQGALGFWTDAFESFTRAVRLELPEKLDPIPHAVLMLLRLQLGDEAGFLESRRAWLRRSRQTDQVAEASLLAQTFSLLPIGDDDDRKLVVSLAKKEQDSPPTGRELFTLGLALHRAGRSDQAVTILKEASEHDNDWESPWVSWPALALAHNRVGHYDEARSWLEKCDQRNQEVLGSGSGALPVFDWREWIEFSVLDREAAQLIRRKLPEEDFARATLARARALALLDRWEEAAPLFQSIAKNRLDDPVAQIDCGRALLRIGRMDEADAALARAAALAPEAPQIFVNNGLWVVGPYPGILSASAPAETSLDVSKPVAGVEAEPSLLRWKLYPVDAQSRLDLSSVFPEEKTAAYVMTRVSSIKERPATLLVGSDTARIWVNGQLVNETKKPRKPAPDQDRVRITLRKGLNTLLVKMVNESGPHALYLRFDDPAIDEGLAKAKNRLWKEAAADLGRAVKRLPDDSTLRAYHALTLLGAGNVDAYRKACVEMLVRFGDTDDFTVPFACVATPIPGLDTGRLISAAKKSVPSWGESETLVAAALYRAGRYKDVANYFYRAQRVNRLSAWDLLFLAMTHQQLHRVAIGAETTHAVEASRCLDRAVRWIEDANKTRSVPAPRGNVVAWNHWSERLEVEHLRREAEALLKAK
jgi:serine/threonine protein kinase/tetratricopeptide (TPR) repeat protein